MASFRNVPDVAITVSPLNYSKDYMQMGIDTVTANRLNIDKTLGIKELKEDAREQNFIEMIGGVYELDWDYKAYVPGRKKTSRTDYYFETVSKRV